MENEKLKSCWEYLDKAWKEARKDGYEGIEYQIIEVQSRIEEIWWDESNNNNE